MRVHGEQPRKPTNEARRVLTLLPPGYKKEPAGEHQSVSVDYYVLIQEKNKRAPIFLPSLCVLCSILC